jgi:hypothetical protein
MNRTIPRHLAKFGFVILCTVFTASCTTATDRVPKEFKFLIHPDATTVESQRPLNNKVWGATYNVEMSYPAMAADTPEIRGPLEAGWTECRGDVMSEWESYIDTFQADYPLCIYRRDSTFLKSDMLLTINHTYGARHAGGDTCPATPRSKVQKVYLTVHSYQDPAAHARELGLTCSR